MGAQPDLRLSWSFLKALAEMWSSHPGTYKVADESEDLVPALAQMCIRAFASEVRESVPREEQKATTIAGSLTKRNGESSNVTLHDIGNKVTHGSPDRIVVSPDGDVRLFFVNSKNESADHANWTDVWFSASHLIEVLHGVLYVAPHHSEAREDGVRRFVDELGPSRLLPSRAPEEHGSTKPPL
ncbi:hypothetical protein J2X46_002966 [Nocardioides sp. BE266]|uniref:hypothetical protein n=1 Tax=Nocardioides sp. BE266 TaxID=2817725 RepID=UPI0028638580|nr:hypothetical protein [Nocardioides sp. BE266]MDR7253976.1 hypothetical protein [Nocardioides sp. BE266]